MIIRNPYGFVAKHFKLINLLLLLPMIYLSLKLGDISSFFKDYIAQGYTTPETSFADAYVSGLMTAMIITMLVVNIVLYILFSSKKKNSTYYSISIIYYLFLLFASLLFHSSMSSIEKDSLDATFANFVRDFAGISHFPIYLLMIVNISKAVGFNYKTLRFDNNSDLKLREEDEEDIEIKVGSDNNTLKRNFVHLIRELKYYILENKFVFTCIGIVLLLIVGYTTYSNYQLYNKTYAINQAFNLDNFTLSLKDSYISDLDYRGTKITDNKYYLAIRIGIQNNGADTAIDRANFRIYAGEDEIFPSYDKSSRFIDVGKMYQGEVIKNKEANEYVFVYELTKNQIRNNYQMRILNGLSEKGGKLIKRYKKIGIKPQNILKEKDLGKTTTSKEIILKDTMLGRTTYKINQVNILSNYPFEYEQCNLKGICSKITDTVVPSGGKVLLVLDDEIKWDETTPYYKNSNQDFYSDFVTINYTYHIASGSHSGDREKSTTLKNITPQVIKDKQIYEVPSTLLIAHKVDMFIKIRNKYVTITIKE